MLFAQVCEQAKHAGGRSFILWEEEKQTALRELLRASGQGGAPGHLPFTINLLVGPEGGFSAEEVSIARRYGLEPITLGPRILRAETAGLVAAAAVLYELGDLG
jgi:16S rRNA (uracil1498-N3)-methyltransferase